MGPSDAKSYQLDRKDGGGFPPVDAHTLKMMIMIILLLFFLLLIETEIGKRK